MSSEAKAERIRYPTRVSVPTDPKGNRPRTSSRQGRLLRVRETHPREVQPTTKLDFLRQSDLLRQQKDLCRKKNAIIVPPHSSSIKRPSNATIYTFRLARQSLQEKLKHPSPPELDHGGKTMTEKIRQQKLQKYQREEITPVVEKKTCAQFSSLPVDHPLKRLHGSQLDIAELNTELEQRRNEKELLKAKIKKLEQPATYSSKVDKFVKIQATESREQATSNSVPRTQRLDTTTRRSTLVPNIRRPQKRAEVLGRNALSDFDLRPCHSQKHVSSVHGFLCQQDIVELIEKTGYRRHELFALWARFKALCSLAENPDGIDKETFRRGVPLLSVEDNLFVDRVFDILDQDASGIIDWEEFVHAMSALERGDAQQRLLFLFRVYDINGDSKISRQELAKFFVASLLVQPTADILEVSHDFVNRIFFVLGCEDSEFIPLDRALQYVSQHHVRDIYSMFGRSMITNFGTSEEGSIK